MTTVSISETIRAVRRLAATVALCLGLAGCVRGVSHDDGKPQVEAAFYPLAFLAERIGGDAVEVDDLTPAGAEPHDVELRPVQVAAIRSADLTLYLRGFQPAVDDAIQGDNAFDLTTVVEVEHDDPHIWLDPVLMRRLAKAVGERLVKLAPAQARDIASRAADLDQRMQDLDGEFRSGLAECARHELVTSHEAFGYLARRYGLRQTGIAGLSPDAEPSARRLAEVAGFVRDKQVTTIFFERLVSPRLAETIAREAGVKTAVLDPVEGGPDYVGAMRANLAALRAALGCT